MVKSNARTSTEKKHGTVLGNFSTTRHHRLRMISCFITEHKIGNYRNFIINKNGFSIDRKPQKAVIYFFWTCFHWSYTITISHSICHILSFGTQARRQNKWFFKLMRSNTKALKRQVKATQQSQRTECIAHFDYSSKRSRTWLCMVHVKSCPFVRNGI